MPPPTPLPSGFAPKTLPPVEVSQAAPTDFTVGSWRGYVVVSQGVVVALGSAATTVHDVAGFFTGWRLRDDGWVWLAVEADDAGDVVSLTPGAGAALPGNGFTSGTDTYHLPLARISNGRIVPVLGGRGPVVLPHSANIYES